MSHSPAPWEFVSSDDRNRVPLGYESGRYYGNATIIDANGNDVVGCDEYNVFAGVNQAENVALMLAAPDLLAECEREYSELADIRNNWPGRSTMQGQQKLCRLRDLIAKATGRSGQDVQDEHGMRAAIAKATGSQP